MHPFLIIGIIVCAVALVAVLLNDRRRQDDKIDWEDGE